MSKGKLSSRYMNPLSSLVFVILFALSSWLPAKATEAAIISGWHLLFDHHSFGRCIALVAPDKARFGDGVQQRLLTAPYDGSLIYNDETQRFLRCTLDQTVDTMNDFYSGARFSKAGSETLLGLHCTKTKFEIKKTGVTGYFWTTTQIKTNPKVSNVCAMMCLIPPGYGMPVKMIASRKGQNKVFLNPLKAQPASFKESDFVVPKGLQQAQDYFELTFCPKNTKYKDNLDSLFMMPESKKSSASAKEVKP